MTKILFKTPFSIYSNKTEHTVGLQIYECERLRQIEAEWEITVWCEKGKINLIDTEPMKYTFKEGDWSSGPFLELETIPDEANLIVELTILKWNIMFGSVTCSC